MRNNGLLFRSMKSSIVFKGTKNEPSKGKRLKNKQKRKSKK